jgi:erythronate-4-phosphate dehydrogenase
MLTIADENIPCAAEAFGQFGSVRLAPGRLMTRADLIDADALIVRSVTRVDRDLLEGTPVRFVGTATIGTDHIDLDYLNAAGIGFADAAGSNANSVAEYITAALLELRERGLCTIAGESLGIIGVGRIGSRVAAKARSLGMSVVEYDPPRELRDPGFRSATLREVLGCRIITLHVPLTTGGAHPTRRLVDAGLLGRLRPDAILINSSRGGVVVTDDLVHVLAGRTIAGAVLDVWEEEPAVPPMLVEQCAIVTPHIAGYSYDGKIAGTAMMADALAAHFDLRSTWTAASVLPSPAGEITIPSDRAVLDAARRAVRAAYDIARDDAGVRVLSGLDDAARRAGFDALRRDYPVRREFPAYRVAGASAEAADLLVALGFMVL